MKKLIEIVDEAILAEFNALSTGNVVGYMAPLGVDTDAIHSNLWKDKKREKVKTASPALHEDLMDDMGYEYVSSTYRLNSDTYVQKDDPNKARSKSIARLVNKNLNKPSGKLNKVPPMVGISIRNDK